MITDKPPFKLKVGHYIDYASSVSNGATVKVIESIDENQQTIKIADPRISSPKFTEVYNSFKQSISIRSSKIRFFRTETKNKSVAYSSLGTGRIRTFNYSFYERNCKELDNFDFSLKEQSTQEIIQFLRGRHYYFMDSLFSTMIDSDQKYEIILTYFKKHFSLVVKYFTFADYTYYNPENIYQSPMSAFCSAYHQIIDLTYVLMGVSTYQQYQNFVRDNNRYVNRNQMDTIRVDWIENQLLPTLLEAKKHKMPLQLINSIYSLFLELLSKQMISKSQPIGAFFFNLFETFVENLDLLQDKRQINFIGTHFQTIAKHFPFQHCENAMLIKRQSEKTIKIDSQSNESQIQNIQDEDQVEKPFNQQQKKKNRAILQLKASFRMSVIKVMKKKQMVEDTIKQMNILFIIIQSETGNQGLKQDELKFEQNWTPLLKKILQFVQRQQLLEFILTSNSQTVPAMHDIRQALLKYINYLPRTCIKAIAKSQKIQLIKFVFKFMNRDMFKQAISQINRQGINQNNYLTVLDVYTTLEKNLANGQFLDNLEQSKEIRIDLLDIIYRIYSKFNVLQAFNTDIGYNYEKVRLEVLRKFVKQEIIHLLRTDKTTLFHENLLQKYLKIYPQEIDVFHFQNLCYFLSFQNILEPKYEKRKTIISMILQNKFKEDREEWLKYLQIFLHYFLERKRSKKKFWTSFQLYSPGNERQFKKIVFNLISSKESCSEMIQKLLPFTFEFQFVLYQILFKRYNFLSGNLILCEDQNYEKVVGNLQYIYGYYQSFYTQTKDKNSKSISAEIERIFQVCTQEAYTLLLKNMLQFILSHRITSKQLINLFNKLKQRAYLIPKLTSNSQIIGSAKQIFRLELINQSMLHKSKIMLQKNGQGKYRNVLLEEENKKAIIELQIKQYESFQILYYKIAKEVNREPHSLTLFYKDKQISTENLKLNVYDFFLNECRFIEKEVDTKYQLRFIINDQKSQIHELILNKSLQIFILMPGSSNLLKGISIAEQDDNKYKGIKKLKEYFKKFLERRELLQILYKSSAACHILLDYFIADYEEIKEINLKFVIKLLKSPENLDDIIKNFKILYLFSKEKNINAQDRQEIFYSLVPSQNLEDNNRETEEITQSIIYEIYSELAFQLIENCQDNLEFLFKISKITRYSDNQNFMENLKAFWRKIYEETSVEQKIEFLKCFQERVFQYGENWEIFSEVLGKVIKDEQKFIYIDLEERVITLLVNLNKKVLSLTEGLTINTLIRMLRYLLMNQIESELLYSQQFICFIKNKIYEIQYNYRSNFMEILQVIMHKNANRRHLLLDFFEKELQEKEWQEKYIFQKPRNKTYQQKNLVGLKNPHSICYVNSFLQQLYHIPEFKNQLLAIRWTEDAHPEQDLMLQLKKIFIYLRQQKQPYFNADFFKAFKNIEGEETSLEIQMDVDQFRNVLLDRIQQFLPKQNNFVQRLFNGRQTSIIKSKQCEHESKKEEDFSSLCLEVKGFENIQASLDSYFKPQILQNQNAYECQQCKRKVKAEKIISINKYPPYLTFVLKRFEYVYNRRLKINSYFKFPLQKFFYFSDKVYKLKGIIVHQGVSEAGHYLSLIKHNQIWYQFNDSHVSEIKQDYVAQWAYGHQNNNYQQYPAMMNKNAYLLIYQIENRSTVCDDLVEDYPCYGLEQELKKIRKHKILNDKEKVYLQNSFLHLINQLCTYNLEPACIKVLLTILITFVFKMSDDNLMIHYYSLFDSIKILHFYRFNLGIILSEGLYEKVVHFIDSSPFFKYKSILVELLVKNCNHFDHRVQKLLDQALHKIYRQNKQNSIYYYMMYEFCKKFEDACAYLNERRIVGRIMDLTLYGNIGQKIRQDLKQSTSVPFQPSFPFRYNKQSQKGELRYYKWQLLNYILSKPYIKITQIERQLISIPTPSTFKVLFEQCTNKPTINHLSKFFQYNSNKNTDYTSILMKFLLEYILRDKSEDLRKYLKVLKDLLRIKDENTQSRNHNAVIIFSKALKKFSQERIDNSLDYVWQWFLKIANKNSTFRLKIKQYFLQFQHLQRITLQTFHQYRSKQHFKIDKSKNRYHGLKFAKNISQFESLIEKRIEKTKNILSNTIDEGDEDNGWDSDADLTEIQLAQNSKIMKYNTQRLKFEPYIVKCSLGSYLIVIPPTSPAPHHIRQFHLDKGSEVLSLYFDNRELNQFAQNSDNSFNDESEDSTCRIKKRV